MDAVQAVAVLSLLLMIRRRNDNFRLRIRTILCCLLIQRRQDIQRLFLLKRLARRQRLGRRARRAWVWPRPQNYILKSCCSIMKLIISGKNILESIMTPSGSYAKL